MFTNVQVDETINIILSNVFEHPTIPPPKISKHILKELLIICTKEVPFITPRGDLFVQKEGVAMGSPLGPTFANYYMGHLENNVLCNSNVRPRIYGRYVDDIFLQVSDVNQLLALKKSFEDNSVLKFTYELNVNDKLPFLDVLVDSSGDNFKMEVYHKPSIRGVCLNGISNCPENHKKSTISNYSNVLIKFLVLGLSLNKKFGI